MLGPKRRVISCGLFSSRLRAACAGNAVVFGFARRWMLRNGLKLKGLFASILTAGAARTTTTNKTRIFIYFPRMHFLNTTSLTHETPPACRNCGVGTIRFVRQRCATVTAETTASRVDDKSPIRADSHKVWRTVRRRFYGTLHGGERSSCVAARSTRGTHSWNHRGTKPF